MQKKRDRIHKKRRWTQAFKLAAVGRLTKGARIASLAAELGVGERLLYDWYQRYRLGGAAALRPMGRPLSGGVFEPPSVLRPAGCEQGRLAELERKIGEQLVDLDFFRAALRRVEARRRVNGGPGGTTSTR